MNPWAEPFERNFNEHSEQALMSIKILFKQLRWTWIQSLRKKPDLQSGKNRFAMEKAIRTGYWTLDLRCQTLGGHADG